MRLRALVLLAALALPGCAALPGILAAVSTGSQYVAALVDVAEAGSRAYLARHPSHEAGDRIEAALRGARLAVAALDGAVAAAAPEATVRERRDAALAAYGALRDLLADLGVLSGAAPLGGAEGDAPLPEPLPLPPVDVVAARMGGA